MHDPILDDFGQSHFADLYGWVLSPPEDQVHLPAPTCCELL